MRGRVGVEIDAAPGWREGVEVLGDVRESEEREGPAWFPKRAVADDEAGEDDVWPTLDAE